LLGRNLRSPPKITQGKSEGSKKVNRGVLPLPRILGLGATEGRRGGRIASAGGGRRRKAAGGVVRKKTRRHSTSRSKVNAPLRAGLRARDKKKGKALTGKEEGEMVDGGSKR